VVFANRSIRTALLGQIRDAVCPGLCQDDAQYLEKITRKVHAQRDSLPDTPCRVQLFPSAYLLIPHCLNQCFLNYILVSVKIMN